MEKSKVYFTNLRTVPGNDLLTKLEKLIRRAGIADIDFDGKVTLADDSGLMVDYLGGAPGVYSARYAGEPCDDDANNAKLFSELDGVPDEQRGAAYVSVVCCVYPDGRKLFARGECRGYIGHDLIGDGGFGYDPMFYPVEYNGEKTMAQLTAEEKDAISHRGKALGKMKELLKKEL